MALDAVDRQHALQSFLQLQLATDLAAVTHLPYVLTVLDQHAFAPNPHKQKWIARINSLVHSQEAGARWAGLCLAHRSSALDKNLMIECAQSWVGAALPVLSKNEVLPNVKASIRLLAYIFSAATDVPEFQRQLCTPNVSKFSQALIQLTEKHKESEIQLLTLSTLTFLIPLYPTLHRSQHANLSSLSLRLLNGSFPTPQPQSLVDAASRLYAILPLTGGKVGAAQLWRKQIDETVVFARMALWSLRETFPSNANRPLPSNEDPAMVIPLNVDRLRCGVRALCELLRTPTTRPVQVPVSALVQLAVDLLSCTTEGKVQGHVDAARRTMEIAVTPAIWNAGCDLVECLAKCLRHRLTPNIPQLANIVVYHLDQSLSHAQRLPFLQILPALLSRTNTHPMYHAILTARLTKSVLRSLTPLLPSSASQAAQTQKNQEAAGTSASKKGRKRARGYEGDEVFKTVKEVACRTEVEGEVVLAALEALGPLLSLPHLLPPIRSLASRILLHLLLSLPQTPPSMLSNGPGLHARVLEKVRRLSLEASTGLGSGSGGVMGKAMGLVVRQLDAGEPTNIQTLAHLLHPPLPPLVRSLPQLDLLSLFRAEEGEEEAEARRALGIVGLQDEMERKGGEEEAMDVDVDVRGGAQVGAGVQAEKASAMPVQEQNLVPPLSACAPPQPITSTTMSASVPPTASTSKTTLTSPPPAPLSLPSAPSAPSQPSVPAPVPSSSTSALPLPPSPLPSTSHAFTTQGVSKAVEAVSAPRPVVAQYDDDDDEEMPTIDLGSSDDEDGEGEEE